MKCKIFFSIFVKSTVFYHVDIGIPWISRRESMRGVLNQKKKRALH